MRLKDLQSEFLAWLTTDAEAAPHSLPLIDHGGSADHGLKVYQNNYRGALMTCLAESYPQTRRWLGEEAFDAACARHIDDNPPSSWTLDDYALAFPASLERDFPEDQETGDLARLELALSQTFIAPDALALNAQDMAYIDWETAPLATVPSMTIIPMGSNAPDLWLALANGDDEPAQVPSLAIWPESAPLLIWREAWLCRFRLIDGDEAETLQRIALGGTDFPRVCAQLIAAHGETAGITRAGQWLAQWCNDGILRKAG